MKAKSAISAFFGRLQVPHRGHSFVIQRTLDHASSTGSAAKIYQIDLENDRMNPHNSDQIKEMIKLLFPKEMSDGRLIFAPLSSLGTGGIKRKETWQAISGGDNENLTVIFGKKHSESDMVGSKHYMEKLSEDHGFKIIAVDPVVNGKGREISASSILRNPYMFDLRSVLYGPVQEYMAGKWQQAFEESCKIHTLDAAPNKAAYLPIY